MEPAARKPPPFDVDKPTSTGPRSHDEIEIFQTFSPGQASPASLVDCYVWNLQAPKIGLEGSLIRIPPIRHGRRPHAGRKFGVTGFPS
jgi:hypothetical protein